jgi:hypothetical protein
MLRTEKGGVVEEYNEGVVVHGLTLEEVHAAITKALREAVEFKERVAKARTGNGGVS